MWGLFHAPFTDGTLRSLQREGTPPPQQRASVPSRRWDSEWCSVSLEACEDQDVGLCLRPGPSGAQVHGKCLANGC